jgi:hypothetical protein
MADSLFVVLRLAIDAEANAWNGLATRSRNFDVAFFAMGQAFALRQLVAHSINRIFHRCVNLILNRAVFRKPACQNKTPSSFEVPLTV